MRIGLDSGMRLNPLPMAGTALKTPVGEGRGPVSDIPLSRVPRDTFTLRFTGETEKDELTEAFYSLVQEKTPVSREAVESMLQIGAKLNGIGANTPLCYAAENGHLEAVKVLIEKNADLNKGQNGWSPLHRAIHQKHPDIAKLLINAGADIHLGGHYSTTPLSTAAEAGDEEIFEILLSKGADPKALGQDNKNMLHDAVSGQNMAILKRLLALGLDPNQLGTRLPVPILKEAAEWGQVDMMDTLLDAGAHAKTTFHHGLNVLHVLASKKRRELVPGTRPDGSTYEYWKDVPTPDTSEYRAQLDKIVKRLLAGGADINAKPKDYNGFTPLMQAVEDNRKIVMEILIQNGADINAYDNNGCRVLDHARFKMAMAKDHYSEHLEDQKRFRAEYKEAREMVTLLEKHGAKTRNRFRVLGQALMLPITTVGMLMNVFRRKK